MGVSQSGLQQSIALHAYIGAGDVRALCYIVIMEIKVKIPDELAAQAEARGLTIEHYVQGLLAQRAPGLSNARRLRSSEEVRAWLDSLTQFSDKIPQLPEEAFTRESFYQDE